MDTGMDAVRAMLTSLRLDSYADAFEDAGYDDLEFIATGVDNVKLLEEIGSCVNMKPGQCALSSNPLCYCSRLTRPLLSSSLAACRSSSRCFPATSPRCATRRKKKKKKTNEIYYNMGGLGREGR